MSDGAHEALISVGSNIEPARWIPRGLELLAANFPIVGVSPAYRSAAVGGTGAPPAFTNLAVRLRTDLGPATLREACRHIETLCARVRTEDRYAPRTLDLDVVLYDDLEADFGAWRLPDPALREQPFVLVPAADVWSEASVPPTGETLARLAARMGADLRASLQLLPEGSYA